MLKSVLIALVCVFALTLTESVQAQLSGLEKLRATSKSPLLSFKDSLFERYVKSERRDYSIYLLFDAGNDAECPYCAGMRKQLTVVATLYNRSIESRPASEQPIFFGVITPKTGGQTFKDFNIQGVPFLICIPPGESGQRFDASLFQIKSLEALSEPYAIAAWVQESSGVTVHIPLPFFRRPEVQYTGLAILILLVLWRLPWLLRNYNRPMVGFILFMIVYVVVMNGTVWNAIHEPPFYVGSGAKLTLFAPSMQSQFKVEGGIMATLFVVLMTLWILLTDYAPNIRYTVLRLPFTAIVFCSFLFLLNSLFRIFSHMKMGGGYPFYFDLPGLLA